MSNQDHCLLTLYLCLKFSDLYISYISTTIAWVCYHKMADMTKAYDGWQLLIMCWRTEYCILLQALFYCFFLGFTINRICWLSTKLLSRRLPLTTSKGLSTAIGLAAIPLIIKPIDNSVDKFMELTFRKYFDHATEFDEQHVIRHSRKSE